jgi:hypothetical protein
MIIKGTRKKTTNYEAKLEKLKKLKSLASKDTLVGAKAITILAAIEEKGLIPAITTALTALEAVAAKPTYMVAEAEMEATWILLRALR